MFHDEGNHDLFFKEGPLDDRMPLNATAWELFEETLISSLFEAEGLALDAMRAFVSYGGKKLRPKLALECGLLFGALTHAHTAFAVALEYIHAASLCHDDVLDHGQTRHGLTCLYKEKGNKKAILFGDFLFSRGLSLLIKIEDMILLKHTQQAIQALIEGQIQENQIHFTSSSDQYIQMIQKKTGALFSIACYGASLLSKSNADQREALKQSGLLWGTSFQIRNDVADYMLPVAQWKEGHDFIEKKITLPILLALQNQTFSQDLFMYPNRSEFQIRLMPYLFDSLERARAMEAQSKTILLSCFSSQALENLCALQDRWILSSEENDRHWRGFNLSKGGAI
jgi:octaprenyl-diphosphate synthase